MKAGANVLIPCLNDNNWDTLRTVAADCSVQVEFLKGDLCDDAFRTQVVSASQERFGSIDILINNAGFIIRKPLLECSDRDWTSVMNVNCDALYFLSRRVAEVMVRQQHGKIIKHAVAGITKNFANELGKYHIQVNGIAPGYIAAGNSEEIIHDEAIYNDFLSRIPAGRWGTPADLQGLAVFLSSEASDYINGAIIPVDGGYLCR